MRYAVTIVCDATAWATVTVEAESEEAARELALSSDVRNGADLRLSEGNYLKRDQVSAEEVEEA